MEESLLENVGRDNEIDDTNTVNEEETPKLQLQDPIPEPIVRKQGCCSPAILICISHALSAWGDRMWAFAIALFLILLTPNSLRLNAIYGLSVSLSVVAFGTLVGDWIDATPRLKAARLTLIIQNVAVVACAGVLLLMITIDISKTYFPLLEFVLILLAIIARLSSLGTTIAIERDWVVVIAKEDKILMAGTNAKLRRIDLTCNILAPVLTGFIIYGGSNVIGIIFIAGWNILSLFAEYFILSSVYYSCPALAIKAVDARHVSGINDEGSDMDEEIDLDDNSTDDTIIVPQVKTARSLKTTWISLVKNIQDRARTLRIGFKLYFKQRISLAGLALACLYLTVLGFDSITSAYAYSQHLNTATIGGLTAAGALTGIIGTFIFPKFRKMFGLVRTGLFSMSIQLFFLMFCVASVWAPGHPGHLLDPLGHRNRVITKTTASPIYITSSSKRLNSSVVTTSYYNRSINHPIVLPTLAVFQSTLLQNSTISLQTSLNYRSTSVILLKTSSIHPSSAVLFAPNTTTSQAGNNTANKNATSNTNHRPPSSYISLGLLMGGIVMSRIGLWMTDLVVTQLFQENIPETERGIVGGVQNSFNNIMDAAHFVLVIFAPNPVQFGALVLVSVGMVSLGFAFYARFAWIVRKRLLQLEKLSQWSASNESVEGSSQRLRRDNRRNSQEEMMKGVLTVENENYSNYS